MSLVNPTLGNVNLSQAGVLPIILVNSSGNAIDSFGGASSINGITNPVAIVGSGGIVVDTSGCTITISGSTNSSSGTQLSWVAFSGSAGGATILGSQNISSVVRYPGAGYYTVYFTNSYTNENTYSVTGYVDRTGTGQASATMLFYPEDGTPPSGTGFSVATGAVDGDNTVFTGYDVPLTYLQIMGY